jgi:cytochrome c oxidase assembly factor CtaG
MDPVIAAALQSWTFDPWILIPLLLTAGIYLRGWRQLRRQMPHRFGTWRLVAFLGGLATIFLAIASPLDAFAGLLLQVHMIQHMLLMMVAPPLILLGAPAVPMLRGLPQVVLTRGLGPYLAWPALRRLGHFFADPLVCWISFVAATLAWHTPALYELALRSEVWHAIEHICFLGTALLFWWPVIQPWPSQPRWPRWAMIPYLLLADIQNTALSAFFIFYERVIYPTYATVPRLWGISVLEDQAAAGAIMWVPGSLIFLVPVGWVIYQILNPSQTGREEIAARSAASVTVRTFSQHAANGAASQPGAIGRISRFLLAVAIAGGGLLARVPVAGAHHGGVVRLTEKIGAFVITVFTEPTPLRAGPVEITVLVQDRDSQRPVLDVEVTVLVLERESDGPPTRIEATRQNATNKLMYAAPVHLPAAGPWELQVTVRQGAVMADVAFEVTAHPPRPLLLSSWPYLALIPLAIGLFGLRQWISRRRRHPFGAPDD